MTDLVVTILVFTAGYFIGSVTTLLLTIKVLNSYDN
jgi:hypothetical protein